MHVQRICGFIQNLNARILREGILRAMVLTIVASNKKLIQYIMSGKAYRLHIRNNCASLLLLLLSWLITSEASAQFGPFTTDSITLVGDEVYFTYHFKGNVSKEEMKLRSHYYLDHELDPYSGGFIENTTDSMKCRVVDYLEIEANMLNVFGMYMTYEMLFVFNEGSCDLTISGIRFMEKSLFERQEETVRDLYFTKYTGKEMMVEKSYHQLFKKDPSTRITNKAVDRFNKIVRGLRIYFVD
ncbi:MAG: hypothetical protein ITG04_11825 [Proteiniphilum sp.]|nr:hypothetical protein [Proteiniphilum sp.]